MGDRGIVEYEVGVVDGVVVGGEDVVYDGVDGFVVEWLVWG